MKGGEMQRGLRGAPGVRQMRIPRRANGVTEVLLPLIVIIFAGVLAFVFLGWL